MHCLTYLGSNKQISSFDIEIKVKNEYHMKSAILTFTGRWPSAPNARLLAQPLGVPDQRVPHRTPIADGRPDGKVLPHDGGVDQRFRRPAAQRPMLADKVQIVQIAADVVPQPAAAPIQHDTVLLAVVVVRLIFAPGRLQHRISCNQTGREASLAVSW